MDGQRWKQLAIGLLLYFFLNLSEAAINCTANQYSEAQRPSLRAIKTIDDFYNWRTVLPFSPLAIATIPLAKRTTLTTAAVLAGFDIDDRAWQYDFLSTRWNQGGCGFYQKTTEQRQANDVYNFKFWQYLDISYYFGHALLTVPPTMWTNAAHKNGVMSLGTFNLNAVQPENLLNLTNLHHTVTVLTDVAKALQFDGYLLNVESADVRYKQALLVLLQTLKSNGLTVIWYDSPMSGGWANYLNEEALPFFSAAGYFQSDYKWEIGDHAPGRSYDSLTKHGLENLKNQIFQAGDVYRTAYKNKPTSLCIAQRFNPFFSRFYDVFSGSVTIDHYTGIGLYAPNWTMFGGGDADPVTDTKVPDVKTFEQSDEAFWEGSGKYGCGTVDYRNVAHFVQPRTVILDLPFYTNFNTGVGEKYFANGRVISDGPWSHFTLQSILPTWQNVQVNSERPTAEAYFDYQTAFEGGSSWRIEDNKTSVMPALFKLFKTNIVTHEHEDEAELVVKYSSDETLQLVLNQSVHLNPVKVIDIRDQWQRLVFKLPEKLLISEMDILVKPAKDGKIGVNVGALKFYHVGSLPVPGNFLVQSKNHVISWPAKHPRSTYRIYGKSKDNLVVLNEISNTVYDLRGNIFNGSAELDNLDLYLIQEVTSAGDYKPFF